MELMGWIVGCGRERKGVERGRGTEWAHKDGTEEDGGGVLEERARLEASTRLDVDLPTREDRKWLHTYR
jgi:hypothetical protein